MSEMRDLLDAITTELIKCLDDAKDIKRSLDAVERSYDSLCARLEDVEWTISKALEIEEKGE